MITVRWTAPCEMSFHGHSGYAPRGKDIVCAGISTLYGTLVACGGHADGDVVRGGKKDLYEYTWRGVELIAEQYGKYVKAEKMW